jgi:hypothetical protein
MSAVGEYHGFVVEAICLGVATMRGELCSALRVLVLFVRRTGEACAMIVIAGYGRLFGVRSCRSW